jgi:hypothetical protein
LKVPRPDFVTDHAVAQGPIAKKFWPTGHVLGGPVTFDAANLYWAIKSPKAPGYLYSFWLNGSVPGAAGGAHSIAFYRSGSVGGGSYKASGGVSAYDPNFGEYAMTEDEFWGWWFFLSAVLRAVHPRDAQVPGHGVSQ